MHNCFSGHDLFFCFWKSIILKILHTSICLSHNRLNIANAWRKKQCAQFCCLLGWALPWRFSRWCGAMILIETQVSVGWHWQSNETKHAIYFDIGIPLNWSSCNTFYTWNSFELINTEISGWHKWFWRRFRC